MDKKLDEKMLKLMFNSIRNAEIKNVKTQKKDDKAMVKTIEAYINDKIKEEIKQNED